MKKLQDEIRALRQLRLIISWEALENRIKALHNKLKYYQQTEFDFKKAEQNELQND